MLDLIPRDHWYHKISDLCSGIAEALSPVHQNNVIDIGGLGKCVPVRSGRAALVAALQALDLPKGSQIAVPLYCCPVVFKAITIAGCRPCFIDVDAETFCMSPSNLSEKIPEVDAVIAVHMFGNMCDISELKAAAQGKPIIEDCAQALGSKLRGDPAGSFGDIAFFSFRSGKYISAGEGGALFTNHYQKLIKIKELIDSMPQPGRVDELIHVVKNFIKSVLRSKPFYGILGYRLWELASKKMKLTENTGCELSQIYSTDMKITVKRFPLLASFIEKQREIADFYSKSLKLGRGMVCTEKPGSFYNRYLYPVTFPSTNQRDYIASYLLDRNIDTMKYLDDVVQIAAKNYGYQGDCPIAQDLSKKVLIIPNYYSLKVSDVSRIVQSLNAGWAEIIKTDQIRHE